MLIFIDFSPALGCQLVDECSQPQVHSIFNTPQYYRSELEYFRVNLEKARDLLEQQRLRGVIAHTNYKNSLIDYKHDVAAYRDGIKHYRRNSRQYINNQILAMRVVAAPEEPQNDRIIVHVIYYYTGDRGDRVFMEAITLRNHESTGYWAYRPAALNKGVSAAQINVGMARAAPDTYVSNGLFIGMYVPQGGVFCQRRFAFEKTWMRKVR